MTTGERRQGTSNAHVQTLERKVTNDKKKESNSFLITAQKMFFSNIQGENHHQNRLSTSQPMGFAAPL